MTKQKVLFTSLAIVIVLTFLLIHMSKVDSVSMEPTLFPGDIVLRSRSVDMQSIKTNDIIIFRSLEDDSTLLVKRVTAIICNSKNEVMFDVRGDNRNNSCDSRSFGYVPAEKLEGKVYMVVASWNDTINAFRSGRFMRKI